MKWKETKVDGCRLIMPEVHYDFRGEYVETWNYGPYSLLFPEGKTPEFVQDDFSVSRKHTLRGLHGDAKTWKLVQAPYGAFLLTVLDVRKDSPTYGVHDQFLLNDKNRWQVLIPAGCANGHLCVSATCIFDYKQTEYYDRDSQFSYSYKSAGIKWPIPDSWVVLSERDRNAPIWKP